MAGCKRALILCHQERQSAKLVVALSALTLGALVASALPLSQPKALHKAGSLRGGKRQLLLRQQELKKRQMHVAGRRWLQWLQCTMKPSCNKIDDDAELGTWEKEEEAPLMSSWAAAGRRKAKLGKDGKRRK